MLATADRTATPNAAPTSWPVIRNPDATPACEAGIPVIEVTETGTKTMPDAQTQPNQARQQARGEVRAAGGGGQQSSGGADDHEPGRRNRCAERGGPAGGEPRTVPAVMASANGRNATPVRRAE